MDDTPRVLANITRLARTSHALHPRYFVVCLAAKWLRALFPSHTGRVAFMRLLYRSRRRFCGRFAAEMRFCIRRKYGAHWACRKVKARRTQSHDAELPTETPHQLQVINTGTNTGCLPEALLCLDLRAIAGSVYA